MAAPAVVIVQGLGVLASAVTFGLCLIVMLLIALVRKRP